MINRIKNSPIIKGTLVLTIAGFLTRIIGFFFRIFLSRTIGAEGLGIYQLIFPIQILCYSLCTSGFETTISNLVAGYRTKDKKKAIYIARCGLVLSSLLSLFIMLIVFFNSSFISRRILFEPRCGSMIKWMSLTIPLASIHACICGYYLGIKSTKVPAYSQLFEQISRVIAIYALVQLYIYIGKDVTPVVAVIGSLFGEIVSVIYCVISYQFIKRKAISDENHKTYIYKLKTCIPYTRRIMKLSIPLTLNRFLSSILVSIQSILIPNMLIVYGLSSKSALSLYGIILGLVFPLIMFPSAIIMSLSMLLLPTISEAQNKKNDTQISKTTEKALKFSSVFGILCSGIFIFYGNEIGVLLFSNSDSGKYICILGFLCPFLYISSTLASVINGLGRTGITFIHSTVSTIIQILFIIFAIPKWGIIGFLVGLLVSTIINSISHIISACVLIDIQIEPLRFCILPAFLLLILKMISNFLFSFTSSFHPFLPCMLSILLICSVYIKVYYKKIT